MIARVVDERHVSRGYDPYNSADQPHWLRQRTIAKACDEYVDELIRKGFRVLARGKGFAIFPKQLYRFTPPI